jgi:hypothetical protein
MVGEPVFVGVDVMNVGSDPVNYMSCDRNVELTVTGGRKKQSPVLFGCFWGLVEVNGCGMVSHPPIIHPGQTVSFWYLLKGHNLDAGDYTLQVNGEAGVRWNYNSAKHRYTDPVDGQEVAGSLPLAIRTATETELKERYASYVVEAAGADWEWELRNRARQAIAEMAPPFLEETLLSFANRPGDERLTVEGLGQIATAESRRDLIALFDRSADLPLRAKIVEKLAGIGTPQEIAFFGSLLAGGTTAWDDEVGMFAALGLARIGGPGVVKNLASALPAASVRIRDAIVQALGNSRERDAVPVLIRLYADTDGLIQNSVCGALATLTHFQWCGGSGNTAELQTQWIDWWRKNGAQLPLFGPDQCPASTSALPQLK